VGEEFVVLSPDLTPAELHQMGEQLCRVVRQLQITMSLQG
jgi:GGDEF domain-containing protein